MMAKNLSRWVTKNGLAKAILVVFYCCVIVILNIRLKQTYTPGINFVMFLLLLLFCICVAEIFNSKIDKYVVHSHLFFGMLVLLLLNAIPFLYNLLLETSHYLERLFYVLTRF
jgi:hypothetical protein